MACFLVPATEAVVATIVTKVKKSKEIEVPEKNVSTSSLERESKIPFSHKLKWLTNMLWGGSALLAFEHVWHGEVTPWFPFLTAASNAEDASVMLHEMATVGVTMAILVTAAWAVMVLVTNSMEKKVANSESAQTTAN